MLAAKYDRMLKIELDRWSTSRYSEGVTIRQLREVAMFALINDYEVRIALYDTEDIKEALDKAEAALQHEYHPARIQAVPHDDGTWYSLRVSYPTGHRMAGYAFPYYLINTEE